jgi:hypothetical protein
VSTMTRPRCGVPVRAYGRATEPSPCWRRESHPGKHRSKAAYLRQAARRGVIPGQRRWRNVKPCGTEPAYRRHLRHREVPCEPCRLAANIASGRYRKTWLERRAA